MRKIVLAAAAVGALALSACSEQTEDATTEAADSAMADTAANVDAAGDAMSDAAGEAAAAADSAADAAGAAAAGAEAEVQDEPVSEAAVD